MFKVKGAYIGLAPSKLMIAFTWYYKFNMGTLIELALATPIWRVG